MAKGNLFNTAKTKAVKASDKKNDKLSVFIPGKEIDSSLVKMAQLEAQIDQLTAELEMAKGVVKESALKAFIDTYIKTGGYPGSFIITTESEASIMAVPMDKYIKCDENRFNELKDTYGDDVVTEKTDFVMNPTLLDKYGEVLSNLIENCAEIADDDKAELFQAKVTYSVSKGSIEKAFTWGKGKVADFIRDIQPIFAMKGAKAK
jgi:hypothetical protein